MENALSDTALCTVFKTVDPRVRCSPRMLDPAEMELNRNCRVLWIFLWQFRSTLKQHFLGFLNPLYIQRIFLVLLSVDRAVLHTKTEGKSQVCTGVAQH